LITILDYGMGNLRSVEKAIQAVGGQCEIRDSIGSCEKLIIPGVGAFGAAMERLEPLKQEIQAFAASGAPLLGICLGQQLLFESSQEMGEFTGLEIIGGTVKYFERKPGLKIPHIGWSALSYQRDGALAEGGCNGEQVYFVHSLHTQCADPADVLATAEYGDQTFAAAVCRGNVWGAQFHPEKSSSIGLRMLRKFVEC
jgi:imidazole glycerol-phosphate synthase subunit HisH